MSALRCRFVFLIFSLLATCNCVEAADDFAPRVISIIPVLNQGLDVALSVPKDRKYAIQATEDFVHWTEFGADVATNGIFRFVDERVSVSVFEDDYCSQFGDCFHIGPLYSIHPESRFYRLMDLSEPQTISGQVVDTVGRPIAGAKISMVGAQQSVVTDDLGKFTFQSPATSDPVARVFIADATGFVRGIAQASYEGTTPKLDFRLGPQTGAEFTPESLEGRTLIFAQQASAFPFSMTFTNNYKTDVGICYVAARSGNVLIVYEIKSSGIFQIMSVWYEFKGGGAMGPAYWLNAVGGYASGITTSFIDTTGAITPPDTLRDHRVDLDFLYNFDEFGPHGSRGILQLNGLNTGKFNATNFVPGAVTGDYSYTRTGNIATISMATDPQKPAQSSYTLIFTSPTTGRFVYVYAEPDDGVIGPGFVGEFRNFYSQATSISLTADITYHMAVPFSQRLELTLGDESTGFRFSDQGGATGIYQFVTNDSGATLTLSYGIEPTETTDEIDFLQLQFSNETAGSITGQMRTREGGEIKTYPITGSFREFKRSR